MGNMIQCANCGGAKDVTDAVFDEMAEHYVCDRQCFDEWALDNAETVGEFYYGLNCYE